MLPEKSIETEGEIELISQGDGGIVRREDDPELWEEIDALVHNNNTGSGRLEITEGSSSGNNELGTQPGSEDGILSAEK